MSGLLDLAEENDEGDLVYTQVKGVAGAQSTVEIDVVPMLRPGPRKTGHVDHLVIEAELYAERDEEDWGGNPARPVDAETAKQAIERIEDKGLTPAWRLVDEPGRFP